MSKTAQLTTAAVIGALYAALTIVLQPISYGPIQIRLSEALCVLPFFYPFTAWGLFAGCLIANIFGGYGAIDIVFGSLATLAACLLTSKIRSKWLAPLPPVFINAVVIGGVLAFSIAPENPWASYFIFAGQVGLGQIAACYCLGIPLIYMMNHLIKNGLLPAARLIN